MGVRSEGHLGGYIEGGDPATYFPALWDWLVNWQGVKSVLDVGCGEGIALDYFRSLGCRVLGIEGVEQNRPGEILTHDFTKGPVLPVGPRFDLVWSCEFVEHVEAQYEENFLTAFEHGDLVLMTHADPGQSGYHHVNCQPASYWIGRLHDHGFILDGRLTERTREIALATNPDPWNHYARSGLAFVREEQQVTHERMEQGEGHARTQEQQTEQEQQERRETETERTTTERVEETVVSEPSEEEKS